MLDLPYVYLCVGVLLGVLFVGVAWAGEYEVVHGKGQELCEVCRQNLEQMTEHPACERTYNLALGLNAPEWKPFDVLANLGAMKQVMKFLQTGDEFAKDDYVMGKEQYEHNLKTIVADGQPWAFLTQVDIDNDGDLDQVLRMPSKGCNLRYQGYHVAYDAPILALKKNLTGIDRAKTNLLVQNPQRSVRLPGDTNYQMYSVFTY